MIDGVKIVNQEVNVMVFCTKPYEFGNSKDVAVSLMWKDISEFLQILIKQDMIFVIRDDSENVIIVEYGHDNHREEWGTPSPKWITEEEEELLLSENKI